MIHSSCGDCITIVSKDVARALIAASEAARVERRGETSRVRGQDSSNGEFSDAADGASRVPVQELCRIPCIYIDVM